MDASIEWGIFPNINLISFRWQNAQYHVFRHCDRSYNAKEICDIWIKGWAPLRKLILDPAKQIDQSRFRILCHNQETSTPCQVKPRYFAISRIYTYKPVDIPISCASYILCYRCVATNSCWALPGRSRLCVLLSRWYIAWHWVTKFHTTTSIQVEEVWCRVGSSLSYNKGAR